LKGDREQHQGSVKIGRPDKRTAPAVRNPVSKVWGVLKQMH
jgi:hypothetical protein